MHNANDTFLSRVAAAYVDNASAILDRCCFVFPNKRSAVFFRRAIERRLTPPALLPPTSTISELVADLSPLVEASRIDRLFVLYNEYNKLIPEPVEIDRFMYWGEMLLSDFDDVDRYLVDPDMLFVNVKEFREIRSSYLTEEQLEVIARYWGHVEDYTPDADRFWLHTGKGSERFLQLWMVLDRLYHAYHKALAAKGLTSPGRLYRDAVKTIKADSDHLSYERYVFVGFNVPTASEIEIFEQLKRRGKADFYWDMPAAVFSGDCFGEAQNVANKALRFISRNVNLFPSIFDIYEEKDEGKAPVVDIINVPSRIGQAKMAGKLVAHWIAEHSVDPANAIDTAIVLPDESLFVSVVNSMPRSLEAVNITMGYPLKRTPVATFMRCVTSMHMRSRCSKGRWVYFHDDLLSVLSHSLASTLDPEAVEQLKGQLMRERRFTVDALDIVDNYPTLAPIFTPVDDLHDMAKVSQYIMRLTDMLQSNISKITLKVDRAVQLQFITAYRLALHRLVEAARTYSVDLGRDTCFQLIERALASESVSMKGEPLKGLQIMGVLETRALDFDKVVMLSMNETIFPKRSYNRSFIPDALRRAYRMSTVEHQESIFAYYFYRLISRASKVALLYDGRTVGMRTSEMSRYLIQLLYPFRGKLKVTHRNAKYSGGVYEPPRISIAKDEKIMEKLRAYLTPGSGKNLSASSINCYIDCPLEFYLRYVENYDIDDPVIDFIDSSTFGTIVHEAARALYRFTSPTNEYPAQVSHEDISRWLEPADHTVPSVVHKAIDENYLKLPEGSRSVLRGETAIMCRIITEQIRQMLNCELTMAPFTVLAAEERIEDRLELSNGLSVNIKQYIDRVDRMAGVLRIVDYKTGEDATSAKSLDDLFDPTLKSRPKAMMQLMLYCRIYLQRHPEAASEPLMPMIYKLRTIATKGLTPLKLGNDVLTDYHEHAEEYFTRLSQVVESIFDPEIPFTPAHEVSLEKCRFCKFKTVCGLQEQ